MRNTPRHMTYMIAETLLESLDVNKFRGYGLGVRNPATLPGRKANNESVRENRSRSRYWAARRKWVQSANAAGVKTCV